MPHPAREDAVRRLIALVDLDPDHYLEPIRAPLRTARDLAAAELATRLAPAWQGAVEAGARDRARDAARRAGIAKSVLQRLQRDVPEVARACPVGPLGRPPKNPLPPKDPHAL